MRGTLLLLLLLAAVVRADPFEPKREELGADDASYARYIETLALLKEMLAKDPARALDRAATVLEPFSLDTQLEDLAKAALAAEPQEGVKRGLLLKLCGHFAVQRASEQANGWIILAGGQIQRQEVDDETKKTVRLAIEMLREALRLLPKDPRVREDLASALEFLNADANAEEIQKLRQEWAALNEGRGLKVPRPALPPLEAKAEKLRSDAEVLEQVERNPDHVAALALRKEALVYDFCANTITVGYDPAFYETVSLLASEDLVQRNLTRTYRKLDGKIDSVPAAYHATRPAQRAQIVEALARDPSAAAGATLLKVLLTAAQRDVVSDAALVALIHGNHEPVRTHLPEVLQAQLFSGSSVSRMQLQVVVFLGDGFVGSSSLGERLLIEAAVALKVKEAAPVLAMFLPLEADLSEPRGIAAAIGELGGPEQADALLKIACDPDRDVYFRREAILALGRVAPARLSEVPAEPSLEIAMAAAGYRAAPTEALLGRVLQGLGRAHEADDAARYLLYLDARQAAGDLERFLENKPNDYAAPLVREAYDKLVARGKR